MRPESQLLRQINPSFVQAGRVTSQAFRPTPKDEQCLSVYDGDQIQPQAAWQHFTQNPACHSVGVMAVSHAECTCEGLPVIADGVPFPEHCYLDYSELDEKTIKKKAKVLSSCAQLRGWLFQAA